MNGRPDASSGAVPLPRDDCISLTLNQCHVLAGPRQQTLYATYWFPSCVESLSYPQRPLPPSLGGGPLVAELGCRWSFSSGLIPALRATVVVDGSLGVYQSPAYKHRILFAAQCVHKRSVYGTDHFHVRDEEQPQRRRNPNFTNHHFRTTPARRCYCCPTLCPVPMCV